MQDYQKADFRRKNGVIYFQKTLDNSALYDKILVRIHILKI